MRLLTSYIILCFVFSKFIASEPLLLGFESSTQFNEQVRWTRLVNGVRVFVNARRQLSQMPCRLLVYATPNGNSYVDYSYGIRLMSNEMIVDGRPMDVANVLKHPGLCMLMSNEGELDLMELRKAAQW